MVLEISWSSGGAWKMRLETVAEAQTHEWEKSVVVWTSLTLKGYGTRYENVPGISISET